MFSIPTTVDAGAKLSHHFAEPVSVRQRKRSRILGEIKTRSQLFGFPHHTTGLQCARRRFFHSWRLLSNRHVRIRNRRSAQRARAESNLRGLWLFLFSFQKATGPLRWAKNIFISKSPRPYFNSDAVRKPIGDWVESRLTKLGKNDLTRQNSGNASGFGRDISKWIGKETVLPSNVISLALVGKNRGHPAVFPVDLPLFFIKLLCPPDGLVVDPFAGSGSTGLAAISQNRRCVLIDNNEVYCKTAQRRLIEEVFVPKSNGRYSVTQANGFEQAKLLDAASSKPMPKSKPVRYSISKRKK
jgi:hypothetical protein